MRLKNFYPIDKAITGLFLFIAGVVLIAGTAVHHGWANYDQNTTLEYTGVIRESGMENPHSYIKLDVKGEENIWLVILAPPSRMQNRGITKEMLESGNTVSVIGHPHRETKGEMRAGQITIGDQTVGLR